MPSESRNIPEQERSIKSRAHEVFVKQEREIISRPTKPFPVYLRETPAFPMSPTVKAMLWFAAIIVGLLFLAAVLKLSMRYGPKRQYTGRRTAVKTSAIDFTRAAANRLQGAGKRFQDGPARADTAPDGPKPNLVVRLG
jgi:hypothetical protein